MNKEREGELVLNGMDVEATAREINAEPWEPLPGMVKVQCPECRYFFAARHADAALCPDCAAEGTRPGPEHA